MAKKNDSMSIRNFTVAVTACVRATAKLLHDKALIHVVSTNQPLMDKHINKIFNAYCGNGSTLPYKDTVLTSLIEKTAEKVIAELQLYIQEEDLRAFEQYLYTDDIVAFESGQHDEYYWQ